MKHKTISVTVGRLLNDANFGNFRAEITEVMEIEEGDTKDDIKDTRRALKKKVTKEVVELLEEVKAAMPNPKKK